MSSTQDESVQRAATKLLLTYRFLRLGILAAVAMLTAALIIEIFDGDNCVRGSISSYFYSPVRTTFTGGLVAVGLCLIVVQGQRGVEEVALNLAGLFAPVVAFIPMNYNAECEAGYAALPGEREQYEAYLTAQINAGISNNMYAYLVVIAIALIGLWVWGSHFVTNPARLGLLRAAFFVYVAAFVLVRWQLWDRLNAEDSEAHFVAAVLMFACFAVAVLANAVTSTQMRMIYGVIFSAMLVAGLIGGVVLWKELFDDFEQTVFLLEAVEIGFFSVFWILQTKQYWDDDPTVGISAVQPV